MSVEPSLTPELVDAPEVEEVEQNLNYKQISKYLLMTKLRDSFPDMPKANLKYLVNLFITKMYYNVEYDANTEQLIKNLLDALNRF